MSADHPPINKLKRKPEDNIDGQDFERQAKRAEKDLQRAGKDLQRIQEDLQRQLKQFQNTNLTDYLKNCHDLLFQSFELAEESQSSTGQATNVDNRRYPQFLVQWADFEVKVEIKYFTKLIETFRDERLFPPAIVIGDRTKDFCFAPVANEKDVDKFSSTAIESPVERIFSTLLELAPNVCYNAGLKFSNNLRELNKEDIRQTTPKESNEVADRPCVPDGLGYRIEGTKSTLIFVYDYKAAHKLKDEDLEAALAKTTLFMEVIQQFAATKTSTDDEVKDRAKADKRVAMALIQVYDYMLVHGLKYGYVIAGTGLVLLYVNHYHPKILYYHLCFPNRAPRMRAFTTMVAQLATFCFLALPTKPRTGDVYEKCKRIPKRWPYPYDDKDGDNNEDGSNDDEEDSSDDDSDDSLAASLLGNSSKNHRQKLSNADPPPTREYCTQDCLLGLKKGETLDEQCPNVFLHRTAKSGDRHPICFNKFTRLVEEQLCKNQYRDCGPLDPYGLKGKIGAIGALFKVELVRYGYTFVAKGTQSVHLDLLQHESKVYSELEKLQGEVVPVYLGIVNLSKRYHLPGGAEVAHMMLMSWAGEMAKSSNVPDLEVEVNRSW
ncbi:metalloprotease-like protein [Xylaria flabelliformis]|nr:metalloprotease-like protein [Xylaria flabelliformis]